MKKDRRPTYAEIAEAAAEEQLVEVEEVDAFVACQWVEDLKARGVQTNNLDHELRNVHLIAQVASRERANAKESASFLGQVIMCLAEKTGGKIVLKDVDIARQNGILMRLIGDPTIEDITIQIVRREPKAGVS